jgi:hypothetical protein
MGSHVQGFHGLTVPFYERYMIGENTTFADLKTGR